MANKPIIAVDPGPELSAYVVWDGQTVYAHGKINNESLCDLICSDALKSVQTLVIEQVMPFGGLAAKSLYETSYQSGILAGIARYIGMDVHRIPRKTVVAYLCGSVRGNDSAVTRAIWQRYAPEWQYPGKGVQSNKGPFYGFVSDTFQAMGVAIVWLHKEKFKKLQERRNINP